MTSSQAAKALIARAIREVLSGAEDSNVRYLSAAKLRDEGMGGAGRFLADLTTDEMDAVTAKMDALAEVDGWSETPADGYHDDI